MGTWKKLIFLLFNLLFTVSLTISQQDFVTRSCSSDSGNYTTNSPFKENLDNILSSVSTSRQLMDTGFYNTSSGQEPNKVNLIVLCRGDLLVEDCRKCVNDSTRKILEVCPNQKEAIGWYNDCMVHYSNTSIFGVLVRTVLSPYYFNTQNASDPIGFTQALRNLMDRLRQQAASGDSIRKFAVGEIAAPDFDTIYGLVQCTPDLSFTDCNNCIGQLASIIPVGSKGARIFGTNCNLRYEIYIFSNLPAPPPPPRSPPPADGRPTRPAVPPPPLPLPLPPTEGNNGHASYSTVIIVVLSIVLPIILVIGICIVLRIRKRKHIRRSSSERVESVAFQEADNEISNVEMLQYRFDTIRVAKQQMTSQLKTNLD